MSRMTASRLKSMYELKNPEGFFFTRNNMKHARDTMSNYYVPAATVQVKRCTGELVECYELQRRKPVKLGISSSAFFSVEGFELMHGEPQQ